MSRYESNDNKSRVEQTESTQRTLEEIEQELAHHNIDRKHNNRIKKLKTGELDIEDAEVIPFYSPEDWDSYEQYKRIVGGVPGVGGET